MELWFDTCLICGESFFSKEDMTEHVKLHQSPTSSKLKEKETKTSGHCPFCPYEGDNENEIQTHLAKEHTEEMATPKKDTLASCIDLTEEDQASGETNHVTEKSCPLCSKTNFLSVDQLNRHVHEHFFETENDQESQSGDELLAIRMQQEEKYKQFQKNQKAAEDFHFEELKNHYGLGEKHSKGSFHKQAVRNMERNVGRSLSSFDYYVNRLEMVENLEDGIDDGTTMNTTVIELLKLHLEKTIGSSERAWLSSGTDFIGRGPGDSGWGCGYRNIQTVLTCLTKHAMYFEKLSDMFHGNVPSIPKIQEMIETAWAQGYDIKGKEQLNGRLVGTRKWIGATEAYAFFASLKLHCRILDFTRPSGPNNTHPLLFQWVSRYFCDTTSSPKVVLSDKPPLYLQHDGHSHTIVGLICKKSSSHHADSSSVVKLIIFDPGISKFRIWRKAGFTGLLEHRSLPNEEILCLPGWRVEIGIECTREKGIMCAKVHQTRFIFDKAAVPNCLCDWMGIYRKVFRTKKR